MRLSHSFIWTYICLLRLEDFCNCTIFRWAFFFLKDKENQYFSLLHLIKTFTHDQLWNFYTLLHFGGFPKTRILVELLAKREQRSKTSNLYLLKELYCEFQNDKKKLILIKSNYSRAKLRQVIKRNDRLALCLHVLNSPCVVLIARSQHW